MRGILLFGALLAACGGSGGSSTDAAIDAPPDIAIDAAIDAPPNPPGVHRWVIDRQRIPANNLQARDFGLDLNGDLVVDNQLGMVLATLASQGFDIQASTDAAVSKGQILMLGEANVAVLTGATFTMYTGANPQPAPCNGPGDTVCRRHLAGTGTFDVAASSAHDTPLTGAMVGTTLTTGPGHLQVAVVFAGGAPITLDLIGARVKLEMVADATLAQSVIAGGVSQTQLDTKVYPALQLNFSAIVAADCPTTTPPDCGCPAASTGRTILNLFDTTPKNCLITIDEIRNNSLIQSLFAPDMTLEGQPALSFGFAATAVKGGFAP